MTALQILKKVRSEMRPNAKVGEYDLQVILKAMHDFAALRQPPVSGSVCDGCGSKFDAMDISVGVCYCCQKEIKQTDL